MTYPAWHLPVPGGHIGGIANQSDGPDVLLAPDAGTSALTWAPVMDRLADLHTVALDWRGHAQSADAPPADVCAGWRDIIRVAGAMLLDRPALVGHNTGGFLALAAAAERPDRISAVVALETAPPKRRREGIDRQLELAYVDGLLDALDARCVPVHIVQAARGVSVFTPDHLDRLTARHQNIRVHTVDDGHPAHHLHASELAHVVRGTIQVAAGA